ncbi:MAG TPA: ABC transporter permease subunit [Isosphaeraceae bacterium]|nr:ABC transporter permease subunit [Isosphaeraceae bacterium]
MRGRGIGTAVLASGIGLIALAPWAAAVVDRGPSGRLRASALDLALATGWDPFARDCLRNSLAIAGASAAGSLVVGVALARPLARRFRGRGVAASVALLATAVPPLAGAIGLRCLCDRLGLPCDGPGWVAWGALVALGVFGGVPLVATAAADALARIEPAWEDAARAAGASPRRVWWSLAWPLVRPEAARAAALVFTVSVFEPGAPLVLGLRRTLAYQALAAATRPDDRHRAAALAVVATAASLLVQGFLRVRGGATPVRDLGPPAGHRGRGVANALMLIGWGLVAATPLAGLVLAVAGGASGGESGMGPWVIRFLGDPEALRVLGNSALLGVVVATACLVLARATAGTGRGIESVPPVPPLALGLGAWLVPWLLRLAAEGHGSVGPTLRRLAGAIDPYRAPGLLLAVALVAVHLPRAARAAGRARRMQRPILIDAARTLGAARWRARLAAGPLTRSPLAAAWALTFARAAADTGPALLLLPLLDSQTLGPALLRLDALPDASRSAALLGLVAVLVQIPALAASARRDVSLS